MTESTYPMIRCTYSYMTVAKNKAFDAIMKIRLGTKLASLFYDTFTDIRMGIESSKGLFVLPFTKLDGICGLCVIPDEDVFDIVFLPEYFGELVRREDERALFEKLYSSADAFGCNAKYAVFMQKIRSATVNAIYTKAALAPKIVSAARTAENIISFIEQKSSVFGIRITKNIANTSARAEFNSKIFSTELLCMLDIALTASTDGKLCFFVNDDFGRISIGFSVNIGKNPVANYSTASAYLLRRTARAALHEPIIAYSGNTFSVAVGMQSSVSGVLGCDDSDEENLIETIKKYLQL